MCLARAGAHDRGASVQRPARPLPENGPQLLEGAMHLQVDVLIPLLSPDLQHPHPLGAGTLGDGFKGQRSLGRQSRPGAQRPGVSQRQPRPCRPHSCPCPECHPEAPRAWFRPSPFMSPVILHLGTDHVMGDTVPESKQKTHEVIRAVGSQAQLETELIGRPTPYLQRCCRDGGKGQPWGPERGLTTCRAEVGAPSSSPWGRG